MGLLVLVMVLCCSSLVSGQNQGKSIFILAGQSNMAGRGGIEHNKWNEVVPPECKPSPQIIRFSAKQEWEEARDPLHADIDPKICGIGPGMSFANTVLAKDPSIGVIGLVPCAVGGTKIAEWMKGMKLYNDMIERTQAALKDGGVLKGLLWFQGESDTVVEEDALSYKTKFEKFVADVRANLQAPTLPVVQVVVTSGDGEFVKQMRKSQQSIKLPNYKQVDSWGLLLQGDKIHLTSESAIKGSERIINDEGAVEVNVEAVDYRKPAGEEEVAPTHLEKVVVTHVHEDDGGATGVVGGAAAKVAEKLQSAKEAVTTNTKTQ